MINRTPFMELRAHASYTRTHYPISYWRTVSGFEVNFVLADGAAAIEVKSTDRPTSDHLKGLRALREEVKCRASPSSSSLRSRRAGWVENALACRSSVDEIVARRARQLGPRFRKPHVLGIALALVRVYATESKFLLKG
jgi:hypothetical protein